MGASWPPSKAEMEAELFGQAVRRQLANTAAVAGPKAISLMNAEVQCAAELANVTEALEDAMAASSSDGGCAVLCAAFSIICAPPYTLRVLGGGLMRPAISDSRSPSASSKLKLTLATGAVSV